ncbi:MAG TPA: hypothetical protein PLL72_23005, partial [Burkholderiaceae bacterium]|nr:hypothetical protein [Burkholderiaceae bacterium]
MDERDPSPASPTAAPLPSPRRAPAALWVLGLWLLLLAAGGWVTARAQYRAEVAHAEKLADDGGSR